MRHFIFKDFRFYREENHFIVYFFNTKAFYTVSSNKMKTKSRKHLILFFLLKNILSYSTSHAISCTFIPPRSPAPTLSPIIAPPIVFFSGFYSSLSWHFVLDYFSGWAADLKSVIWRHIFITYKWPVFA